MAVPSTVDHELPNDVVVIAGGGPVGLILARCLSLNGVRSILFERNTTTTKWPKMDLTNSRSMELFHKIGLADDLRKLGVPSHIDMDVLISTGMGHDKLLSKWDLPGVDKSRSRITEHNDGTQPQEPGQRISQVIFEKWLKEICDVDAMVDLRYGWTVLSVVEEAQRALTVVADPDGKEQVFSSKYMVGCDGGSSTVRRALGIPLEGGPIGARVLLVHFKSRDLQRLHKHGQFWHIFFTDPAGSLGAVIIAQDEIDTWTTHLVLPEGVELDAEVMRAEDLVARALGGMHAPYPVTIDEVLVRSTWRPYIAVTKSFSSPHHRVFLAGDAAHQNIPTGGYGMNMGIADAFDLGWKLSAVIKKIGGPGLLTSYEAERKPVAQRNTAHSGELYKVHTDMQELLTRDGLDPRHVDEDTQDAEETRSQIHRHYQEHDIENRNTGVEMDYRYQSEIVIPDPIEWGTVEPDWNPRTYTPSTWPGSRPPHVFLSNGRAIFDEFSKDWTLLVFSDAPCGQAYLIEAAERLSVPLEVVSLAHEALAKKLYERQLVLIRPDQHVAWRADVVKSEKEAENVLQIVAGWAPPAPAKVEPAA